MEIGRLGILMVCGGLFGLIGCKGSLEPMREEARKLSGMNVQQCGGARYAAPHDEADEDCAQARFDEGKPYEIWGSSHTTIEGDPVYFGGIWFLTGGTGNMWSIDDYRADEHGHGAFLLRCTYEEGQEEINIDEDCEERVCVADCRPDDPQL